MKQHNIRNKNLVQLLLITMIVVFINYISTFLFFRVDLTSEKRYTLKPVTKEILRSIEDVVYIKIYLDGTLPVEFQQLQKAIAEQLDEFRVYAGSNLEYEFINPSESSDQKIREELYKDIVKQGIEPVNIKRKGDEGEMSQKIIFPGAVIHYKDRQLAVNLLNNVKSKTSEENLINSIEALEYEFITAIKVLGEEKIRKVAFLEGHGELGHYQTEDITRAFAKFFQVDRGTITHPGCLDDYELVVIAKPEKKFKEKDKFVIDQYIMNGGKVMWFVDRVSVNMDSLTAGTTVAMIRELNLEDQLFKYGVRINPNLVKDIQCNLIPVNTGSAGGQTKWAPAPWLYYPLLKPSGKHPITEDIDLVKAEYVNEIDTLSGNPEISSEVLLFTSEHTQLANAPMIISLKEIEETPDRRAFNKPHRPVAVMLEGVFPSVFQNRMINDLVDENIEFKSKSKETQMLVVSDGDMIRNHVRHTSRGPAISPLGYDRYTKQTFGNKSFITNALHYMTDQQNLMEIRSKDLEIRMLDKVKIKDARFKWQFINVLVPVLFIVFFGMVISWWRKRRYTRA